MVQNSDSIKYMLKGMVTGTAKYFSITDSDCLNINLDSTEEIKTKIESRGNMISLHI